MARSTAICALVALVVVCMTTTGVAAQQPSNVLLESNEDSSSSLEGSPVSPIAPYYKEVSTTAATPLSLYSLPPVERSSRVEIEKVGTPNYSDRPALSDSWISTRRKTGRVRYSISTALFGGKLPDEKSLLSLPTVSTSKVVPLSSRDHQQAPSTFSKASPESDAAGSVRASVLGVVAAVVVAFAVALL